MKPAPQERYGGPFDGRVDTLGPATCYEAPVSKVTSLGIPFRGGRVLGYYRPEPGNSSRLVWTEAKRRWALR